MANGNGKVFIFAPADETGESHRELEAAGCTLVLGDAKWSNPQGNSEDEMAKMAEGAAALIGTSIRSSPISRKILEASPDLRIVAKYTIGVDDIDVDAATELGILVTHAPTESNWGGVAEGTMAIMLGLLKRLRERDEQVKSGGWRDEAHQGEPGQQHLQTQGHGAGQHHSGYEQEAAHRHYPPHSIPVAQPTTYRAQGAGQRSSRCCSGS